MGHATNPVPIATYVLYDDAMQLIMMIIICNAICNIVYNFINKRRYTYFVL